MLKAYERALGPVLSFQRIWTTCNRRTYKPRIYALVEENVYSCNLAQTIRKESQTHFILIRACKHIHFILNDKHAYKRDTHLCTWSTRSRRRVREEYAHINDEQVRNTRTYHLHFSLNRKYENTYFTLIEEQAFVEIQLSLSLSLSLSHSPTL
jgi:hypothetical protein